MIAVIHFFIRIYIYSRKNYIKIPKLYLFEKETTLSTCSLGNEMIERKNKKREILKMDDVGFLIVFLFFSSFALFFFFVLYAHRSLPHLHVCIVL